MSGYLRTIALGTYLVVAALLGLEAFINSSRVDGSQFPGRLLVAVAAGAVWPAVVAYRLAREAYGDSLKFVEGR